jgi:hypothetical protein
MQGFNNSQPSEGRLPFRIAAGPGLATLLFRAGGVHIFAREVFSITAGARCRFAGDGIRKKPHPWGCGFSFCGVVDYGK